MPTCVHRLYLYIMGQCLPLLRRNGGSTETEAESSGDTAPLHAHEHRVAMGDSGTVPHQRHSRSHQHSQHQRSSASAHNSQSQSASEQQQIASARRITLIQHLPTDTYVNGGKGDTECIICMEEMKEGDRMRFLPCMHSYHVHCIDDWLTRRFTCPSCLEPVEAGLINSFSTAESSDLSQMECTVGSTGRPNTHASTSIDMTGKDTGVGDNRGFEGQVVCAIATTQGTSAD